MVDPWSTPNLTELLLQHGWTVGQPWASWTGMARRLDAPIEDMPLPAGITMEEVTDAEMLQRWVEARFVEYPVDVQPDFHEVFCALGCGAGRPWSFYQAMLDGEPISFCINYYHAGVAGLYFIGTHTPLRRRGIGTAITRYALQEAQRAGYPLVILQASAMGDPIYRALGFGEYCRIGLLDYRPGD
jgi:GNAT superfamily N-acetyltransferase